MDDYFKADRHERAFIDSLKPPTAHKHRKPLIITAAMIREHRQKEATRTTPPKHRGEPRPTLEELRYVNAHIGRAHA